MKLCLFIAKRTPTELFILGLYTFLYQKMSSDHSPEYNRSLFAHTVVCTVRLIPIYQINSHFGDVPSMASDLEVL